MLYGKLISKTFAFTFSADGWLPEAYVVDRLGIEEANVVLLHSATSMHIQDSHYISTKMIESDKIPPT